MKTLQYIENIYGVFTTRELAHLIWFSLVLVFMLISKHVRLTFFNLLKVALHRNLIVIYILLLCSLTCTTLFFKAICYWDSSLLYDAVVWFIFTALSLVWGLKDVENDKAFLKLIKNEFSAFLIAEFFLSTFSYSLFLELFMLPIMLFLYFFSISTQNIRKVLAVNAILGIIVLTNIISNICRMIDSYTFSSLLDTCYRYGLPLAYTIYSTPLLFVLYVYINYERLFVSINHSCSSLSKRDVAKLKFSSVIHCRFDVDKIRKIRLHSYKWLGAKSVKLCYQDIKMIVNQGMVIHQRDRASKHIELYNDIQKARCKLSEIGLGELTVWRMREGDNRYCAFTNYQLFGENNDICLSLYLWGSAIQIDSLELHMHIASSQERETGLLRYEEYINRISETLKIELSCWKSLKPNEIHKTSKYEISLQHQKVLVGETWQLNIFSLNL